MRGHKKKYSNEGSDQTFIKDALFGFIAKTGVKLTVISLFNISWQFHVSTVNVFTTMFLQCEVTKCFNYRSFYWVGSKHSEAIVKILKKKKKKICI